ncbi:STAS/SEC14 domain-containing protein [Pseudohongiella sp. SYSU M77423]|uniref:STAS/SEC14 domain-containing protein n=1 Tax=Pseudohongiella sp. SYSU M77423 TaxID=3042312 RepID=UPI00247FDFBF|nr:STAS/SEC14 domain-containing protein [Pseudohongiella sp. SYSU M77423]MDH7943746.1 STAS/SEC14 domain-containing protein [Pseudohongiella sp. SYSU M77423]MEC8861199.1 STAS/SEC14 domain-containing protein [Pseudomonadota bacterium]
MFKVERVGPKRLNMEFSGKLDSTEMEMALDEIITHSEGIEDGEMLFEIPEFRFPTPSAMAVEFSRLPAMFRVIRRFNKAAVLADETWVQRVSELEGMLIPWMRIKAFKLSEKPVAEAWLSAD